nr:lon protease homolog 1, mitochondrial-like [Ipomoea trifida]
MLKVLTSNSRFSAVSSAFGSPVRIGTGSNAPLLRFLNSLRSSRQNGPYLYRRFFCSDSTDGSDPAAESEAKRAEPEGEEAVESKASSAMVPTVFRPEDCLTVIALPLPHRPLFPGFYMPIYVKDPKLLAALVESRKRQAPYAGAFLLKDEPGTDPSIVSGSDTDKNIYELKGKDLFDRLHEVGTLAQISSIQGDQVVLIGHRRIRITEIVNEEPLTVNVDHLKEKPYNKDDDVIKATSFEVISTLRSVLKTSSLWRDHVQTYTTHIGEFTYARLADFGAAISGANKLQCQEVLEELDVHKRLQLTLELVKKEMEISRIQESIAKAIEEKVSGEQRRYLLNEQLKAIKKELGLETDDKTALSAKFRERLEPNKDKIPAHVMQVIEEELTKLQLLEASSSEFNVTRNYLDWLTALPWGTYSNENFDVLGAQKILDEDHYGLSDVKERILEFIAVGKLRGTSQGKIICLSGPPGVGKTSIGRSIARALNRKFYRFSVGGLSDVAEIKGHRRTYIGAMPGKMVQCLKSVGTANPLVLIDEIDKLGRGHAGDPASAMLELLDPEQNANFLDHYLDVPIDLSKVLFVCTANVVEMIPNPLLDRMEVISIAGYITDEKVHIARDYLEKATREACGIKPEQVELTDGALLALIENYCREAGVRNLQKQIEKIYRKIALHLVRQGAYIEPPNAAEEAEVIETVEVKTDSVSVKDESAIEEVTLIGSQSVEGGSNERDSGNTVDAEVLEAPNDQTKNPIDQGTKLEETEKTKESDEAAKTIQKVVIDTSNIADYVGKPVFHAERIYDRTPIGVVMGLAWTSMGGSTLYIETTKVEQGDGKGALNLTGQLGDVMKESAQIANTVARTILLEKEPDNPFFANTKLHLHVPAGATPKDGPSAGCTMITSLLSLAMNKHVKKDLAMTGEVTLTGKILPIGGVKEKTIAARRSNVKTIIFPSANRRDFDELAPNVKDGLDVHFVDDYAQIYDLAFGDNQSTEN